MTTIRIQRYKLTGREENEILNLLCGVIGFRELGRRIDASPQQSINLVAAMARQWMRDGRIAVTDKGLRQQLDRIKQGK